MSWSTHDMGGGLVRVQRIRFGARVGVDVAERDQQTPIEVDVVARLPLARAAASDDIRDTLDYRGICQAAVEIGTGRSYHLIESMAAAIVAYLHELNPEVTFEVTVWKVRPPLVGGPERVGVTVARPGGGGLPS